jgi:hypothetical protein
VVDANLNLIVIGPTHKLAAGTCAVDGYEWSEKSILRLGQPMAPRAQAAKKKAREAKPEKAKPKPKPKPRLEQRAPAQQQQPRWDWREQWRW